MSRDRGWEATLRGIVDEMAESGVTELDVRHGDVRIRLRRAVEPAEAGSGTPHVAPGPHGGQSEAATQLHRVAAPLTGIFYAVPNPSSKPYVEVGDWVEEGTVVGLIETMKVFNEIPSDCSGRVTAVLVQQGQLVQAGEGVIAVDTAAAPDHAAEVSS